MIQINCSIAVVEAVGSEELSEVLGRLIDAYAYLNWPLVITDRWLRDGQPIPHDLCQKAIWNYQHSHPYIPAGITFSTSSNPGFDTMMKHLVRPKGRIGIDPKYTEEKFSLRRSNREHVGPAPLDRTITGGRQAQEFAKLRCFDAFFDVLQWEWRYNTVQRG